MENINVHANKSITEYFIDLIEEANKHQHFNSDTMMTFYMVNLLQNYVRSDHLYISDENDEETLVSALEDAMNATGVERESKYKHLGDYTLFVSGFFHDSLSRSLVDVNYYIGIGRIAYRNVAAQITHGKRKSFQEFYTALAEKFKKLVDVLSEVSDRVMISNNGDILRIYDRWLKTGSERDKELLKEKGILPLRMDGAFTLN